MRSIRHYEMCGLPAAPFKTIGRLDHSDHGASYTMCPGPGGI
jgi:hypothetical protein